MTELSLPNPLVTVAVLSPNTASGARYIQLLEGPLMKQLLVLVCLFTAAAGIWLGVMENILRHPGYGGRSVIALCIVIQSLATFLFLMFSGRAGLGNLILTGAVAMAMFGVWAISKMLTAQHFEGYILLIGGALVTQGALTMATLLRRNASR